MAQHDYNIANDTAANVRSDLNNVFSAIVSLNSGATEPATTFAYQWWYDTATNKLKQRNAGDDAWITILTLDQTNDTVEDITVDNITNAVLRARPYTCENIGVTLSGGVLTLAGYDGTALSATNPAYVCMPSNGTPGEVIVYTLTANLTIDESDMTGNTFGSTASVAWGSSMPLYLSFCSNDSDNALAFGVTRVPHMTISPANTDIGDPSAANADQSYSFFSGQDITETSYDGNNLFAIGSVTATKDASDQWTFDAIVKGKDGIGFYNDSTVFTMPTGQNGAQSGFYFEANGGTAPGFSSGNVQYTLARDGNMTVYLEFQGSANNGSGAVDTWMPLPIPAHSDIDNDTAFGTIFIRPGTSDYRTCNVGLSSSIAYGKVRFNDHSNNSDLQHANFSGSKLIRGNFHFMAANS